MKTLRRMLIFLMILVLPAGALCETITFQDFSADSEAEYINLEGMWKVNRWSDFYAFLEKFPNLKKVDMFDILVYNKDMFDILVYNNKADEIHERFPNIEFGMTMRFGEHTLRTDDTAFSTLHGYYPEWHSCAQMHIVKYCKNLYALDLGHNEFDDLSFLYDMPQLRVLIIAAGNAKDITPIGSLKHLEYLEIFNNSIEDISCLKDMPYLMDLNIVQNLIDDISPLKELKSLKRLWIFTHSRRSPGPESEETLAELQKALPNCYIDGVSTSTAGGWREHPHYDVIYRMFRSRVYEPFADSPPENIPEGFAPHPRAEEATETPAATETAAETPSSAPATGAPDPATEKPQSVQPTETPTPAQTTSSPAPLK